jgi:CRISPR type III-associated protein (TIGR04423 family)
MDKVFQKITIEEIPDYEFQGYYWYSNQREPEYFLSKKIDLSIFSKLPFVIEANFFAKNENVSIQVKNIDGNYYISLINLNLISDPNLCDKQEYIAHDLGDVKKYKMIEAWEEKADDLLEGMNTLVPSWTAFAGFINS